MTYFTKSVSLVGAVFLSCVVSAQCVDRSPVPGDLGYKSRGVTTKETRCEGLINKNIAGLTGEVISLTNSPLSYYLRTDEEILIYCPKKNPNNETRVSGRVGRKNLYYALDMEYKGGEQKSIPVKDVLQPKVIESSEFGLFLEWKNLKDTFSPVNVGSKLAGQIQSKDSVFVKFYSMNRLIDVQIKIADPATNKIIFNKSITEEVGESDLIEFAFSRTSLGLVNSQRKELVCTILGTTKGDKKSNLSRTFKIVLGDGI